MADGTVSADKTPSTVSASATPTDDKTFILRMFESLRDLRRRTRGLEAPGPDGPCVTMAGIDQRERLGCLLQPYTDAVRDAEEQCRASSHGPTKVGFLSDALVLVRFVILALEHALDTEDRHDRQAVQEALQRWRQKHKNFMLALNQIDWRVSAP